MADRQKYWCPSCKYRFSRTHKPNLCPFCGKEGIELDISQGAEDLLREVED